jgi:hypothetical protein
MAQRLKNLKVTRVALCAAGMNQEAEIALFKSAEEPSPTQEVGVSDETTNEETVAEETVTQAAYDAVVTELNDLKASIADTAEVEDIDKAALPESVQKALAEADELREQVAKMQHDARIASFRKQAADEFGDLGPADELGAALEEIDRVAPDASKTVVQTLKSIAARVDTSALFKEFGASGETQENEADALIAAEVAKGVSRPDAIRKVFTDHPELYPAAPTA